MVFANLALYPTNIAAWLVVGLTVGWLAGKVMENPSLGIKSDLLLGSIGAVACGALPGFFVDGDPGFLGRRRIGLDRCLPHCSFRPHHRWSSVGLTNGGGCPPRSQKPLARAALNAGGDGFFESADAALRCLALDYSPL